MAMVVQHNLSAMNANRMLTTTSRSQAQSTEKLSSGFRINRAADDAAGLSISEKMRKQIRGLSRATSNAQDGISSVQTAEGALTEVHSMLQRMNELAVQASNGTNSASDRQSIQDEIDQLVTEIDRVSETTKFNETYLLKGDKSGEKKIDFQYKGFEYTAKAGGTLYDSTGTKVEEGTILDKNKTYYTEKSASAVPAEQIDQTAASKDLGILHAESVKFSAAVYTRDEDGNVTYVAAGTNVAVGTTVYGSASDAANNGSNKYEITQAKLNGDTNVDVWKTGGKAADAGIFVVGGTTTDIKVEVSEASSTMNLYTVDGTEATTINKGEKFAITAGTRPTIYKAVEYTGKAGTEVTESDFGDYANAQQLKDKDGNDVAANGLYSYFDEEGTYKGGLFKTDGTEANKAEVATFVDTSQKKEVGQLELKLHVGADATTNNQISVKLDAMSAKSIGIDKVKVTGEDDTNALNAIETIGSAIKQVSEQRSALGAVQNRLEHTISNLENITENTTSAESSIRDTDMAKERVEFSKNNILAQAGQAMLAQANQSNQGVLSLLG